MSPPEIASWTLPAVLLVALLAVLLALWAVRRGRRAAAVAEQIRSEQSEAMRWVATQLSDSMDRFHRSLGELSRELRSSQDASDQSLHGQLEGLRTAVSHQLQASQDALGQGLASATTTFGSLQKSLGEVSEMASRMQDLATQVHELGAVLKVPKLRGGMGEHTLEAILRQLLPERVWEAQHRFADGKVVDVVIHLGERLLPVDAKFPLEAFRRLAGAENEGERSAAQREILKSVRSRVQEIASRYLRPADGTTDFALMFIPAEGVYHQLVAGGDGLEVLLDEALSRRVVPVSPSSIFAFLSVLAAGLRGFEVEARAQEILTRVAGAERELDAITEDLNVLGRHLHNASQRQEAVERHLQRLGEYLGAIGAWQIVDRKNGAP